MIFLARVAQLVISDVEHAKPNLISKPLLSILQGHFRIEKNIKRCSYSNRKTLLEHLVGSGSACVQRLVKVFSILEKFSVSLE